MDVMRYLDQAKPGTDWLTNGFSDSEIKLNKDLGLISSEIEAKRIKKGMSQKELADLLGVTQGMVSRYESGEYNFTLKTLNDICLKIGLEFRPDIHDPDNFQNKIILMPPNQKQHIKIDLDEKQLEEIA